MSIIQVEDYLRHKRFYLRLETNEVIDTGDFILLKGPKDTVFATAKTGLLQQDFHKTTDDFTFGRMVKAEESETFFASQEGEMERVKKARFMAENLKLDMHFFASRVGWNGNVVSFFFTSDKPVDFRELLKEMIKGFNGRVHLERVDVRERARMLDAGEMCGAYCFYHLPINQDKVTLNAVRDQGIVIKNNIKIFDASGKIKPSMMYELEAYKKYRKYMPHLHQEVDLPALKRRGKVIGLDILNLQVKVAVFDADIDTFSLNDIEFAKKQVVPEDLVKPLEVRNTETMIEELTLETCTI